MSLRIEDKYISVLIISALLWTATIALTTLPIDVQAAGEAEAEIVSHSSYTRYREYLYYSPANEFQGEWRNGTFLHIVGVAQNTGTENIEEVRITATFYDEKGSVIDLDLTRDLYLWDGYYYNEEGYPSMWHMVAPGQKLPFELALINEELSMKVEDYELSLDFDITPEEPYGAVIILDHDSYVSYGDYDVVGEVQNKGEKNAEHVVILAAFYDEDGKVIGADIGWTHSGVGGRQILVPGQRWPFELTLFPREEITGDVRSYELSVLCFMSNQEPYRELQILNHTSYLGDWAGNLDPEFGWLNVKGQVKNIGEVDATWVCVEATFYDADGRVVGCGSGWVEVDGLTHLTPLHAGETGSFQLDLSNKNQSAKVASYVLQVDCEEYSMIKQQNTVSCTISESTLVFGETVEVSGSIVPARDGLEVMLNFTGPDATIQTITVTTVDGDYSDSYTPDKIGLWSVKSSWAGDEDYEGVVSESLSFTVVKAASTISCSVSDSGIGLGETIMVSGYVSPARGDVDAMLTFTRPDGSTLTETVVTAADGSFTNTFNPEDYGEWFVTAGWLGDAGHDGATSPSIPFKVERPVVVVVRETPSPQSTGAALVVGTGMTVGFTALMSLSGLAQSFNSAVSRLSVPDWLKDFLMLYSEETFSSLTEEELKARKHRPVAKRELASLIFSALTLLAVFIYVEVNGLPNLLDPSYLLTVIPSILLSVVIVFVVTQLIEVIIAGSLKILAEFKVWLYGLAALLITGILFFVPFSSPGRVEYQGELDERKAGLTATMMILSSLMLSLPFYLFHSLGFVTLGDAGLMMSMMTACYSAFPFKPLKGEAVFRYKRSLWLATFLASFSLFLCITLNVLPHSAYLLVGIAATALFTVILSRTRALES